MNARRRMKRGIVASALGCALALAGPTASAIDLVGMGDSIGEGVQAADAAVETQVFSYLNWVGFQMGAGFTLPLIQTNLFGFVGDPSGRSRIDPNAVATNVAVSGATLHSLLNARATATSTADIASENDLVLFPRRQTQIEYAESAHPKFIICWIGNNDALASATSFAQLDASQLTPLASFDADFVRLAGRLKVLIAGGTKVVFANIPEVTKIGFLVNRATAERFLGFPVNLPDGNFTTIIGMFLMGLSGDSSLLADPNFVLDSTKVAAVNRRITEFNAVIQREADRLGMPVVDVHAAFNQLAAHPPEFLGIPLRNEFLGGMFSLDGVHPSTIGHALLANEFIGTMNKAFSLNIPLVDDTMLLNLFLLDPHIDKDGDLSATGRFGVGLLETLALLLGITGDPDDFTPAGPAPVMAAAAASGASTNDWLSFFSFIFAGGKL